MTAMKTSQGSSTPSTRASSPNVETSECQPVASADGNELGPESSSAAGAGGAVSVAGADAGQVWTFRTPADPHHDWEPDPKHDSGRGVSRGRD